MKKEYYSNCFIEAIKAKIKYGKNVKLIRKSAKHNTICSHWMWYDKRDNSVYDFHASKDIKHIYQCLWFKGSMGRTFLNNG